MTSRTETQADAAPVSRSSRRCGRRALFCLLAVVIAALFTYQLVARQTSVIRRDERIVFFPTAARLSKSGTQWIVPVHGWIFEPEPDSAIRIRLIEQCAQEFELKPNDPRRMTLETRVRPFIADNESRKQVLIEIAGRRVVLPASGDDGHFQGTVQLPVEHVRRFATQNRLSFRAVLPAGDRRRMTGTVFLIPPQGLSVISDIDDTIRVTEVVDRRKMLRNTLLEPFRPVAGMPVFLQQLEEQGAVFHYVSLSPWQLYEPLNQFLADSQYPSGTFHLTSFQIQKADLLQSLADPAGRKRAMIEPLLKAFPQRQFIFVGDSGQKDPEVYGEMARRFPDQVRAIHIRNTTGESTASPRYADAFRGLKREQWHVFDSPPQPRSGS